MENVSFGSTYRIPLMQEGVNAAKRQNLKTTLTKNFQNVLSPKEYHGNVRISVRKRLDSRVERIIERFGFKVYQKFDRNNIPKTIDKETGNSKIDDYIKEELINGNYKQVGKQKAPLKHPAIEME